MFWLLARVLWFTALLKATMPKLRSIFTVLILMLLLLVSVSSGMPFHTLFPSVSCIVFPSLVG
jgi:hypothetical protein